MKSENICDLSITAVEDHTGFKLSWLHERILGKNAIHSKQNPVNSTGLWQDSAPLCLCISALTKSSIYLEICDGFK